MHLSWGQNYALFSIYASPWLLPGHLTHSGHSITSKYESVYIIEEQTWLKWIVLGQPVWQITLFIHSVMGTFTGHCANVRTVSLMVMLARVSCLCAFIQAVQFFLLLQPSAHMSLFFGIPDWVGCFFFVKLCGGLPVSLTRQSFTRAALSHSPLCP